MHELALIQSIVTAVEERVQPAHVDVVRLQIGQLAGVSRGTSCGSETWRFTDVR